MKQPLYIISLSLLLTSLVLPQTIQTEAGTVEFIGLKKWDYIALADTLKAIDPNGSLHACSAILTTHLNFADANVFSYEDSGNINTIVTVIEPEDSSRVKYKSIPTEKYKAPPDWQNILPLLEDRSIIQLGIQFYDKILQDKQDELKSGLEIFMNWIDKDKMNLFWNFLYSRKSIANKEDAFRIMDSDGNKSNRIIAVALLSNFPEDEETWLRIINTLRDAEPDVRLVAALVISMFSNSFARKIDWSPAEESLRYLLNGTNLMSFDILIDLLTKTELSPELGKRLLRNNSELLFAYLGAENENVKRKADSFLLYLFNRHFKTIDDLNDWLDSNY